MEADQKIRESFRRFSVTAKANKTAEILLYDQIGESFWGGGTSAKQFAEQLKAVDKVDSITLRINSPGGDVFEGAAMYDLISQSSIPVDVVVDGLAASAAFTVAMAGRSISIGEAGMMMMHNARGMTFGTADDMKSTADVLTKISDQMAGLYAKRSGMPLADVKALMDAETWLTPEECVAKGFAGKVIKSESGEENVTMVAAAFDLSKAYQHVPKPLTHQVAIAASAKFLSQSSGPRPAKEQHIMSEKENGSGAAVEVKQPYGPIASAIMKLGKEFKVNDADVQNMLDKEASVDEARSIMAQLVLARAREDGKTAGFAQPTVHRMTETERQDYSVRRALLAMAENRNDGFEFEVSADIAKTIGREPRGIYIPTRLKPQASGLDTKTSGAGKYTVIQEVRDLIELLRNRMKLMQLGATVLTGLQGDVMFPRELTASAASWVGENPGSDLAESDGSFGNLSLRPKTIQSTTSYSRQLLVQSSIDVEAFIRSRLATAHALGIDLAGLDGTGTQFQPLGLLRTPGIGSVIIAANAGGAPTYGAIVDLETAIADANADEANMAFLTTPIMRGKLKKTIAVNTTYGSLPIWMQTANAPGQGDVLGYPGYVSKQVPANKVSGANSDCHAIILAYWPTVMIGEWGVVEITVDPFRLKKQGMIEVTSFQMVDVGVNQPAQIAAIQDARNV